jgi:integrase
MSVQQLPSGRWRAQVYDPVTRKNVSVSKITGEPGTYRTKTEAKQARARAREALGDGQSDVTVADFHTRWTTDPLFAKPKESTGVHNLERTQAFAKRYATMPIARVGDEIVGEWLKGGKRNGTVPALRAMFNDAASAKAGRLIRTNPFAGLGLEQSRGNRDKQPPSQDQMEHMLRYAWKITPPSFAGYLEFASVTAMRPGELDALRPDAIDYEQEVINVREQWNAKVRKFTTPKYGPYTIALVGRAREVLQRVTSKVGAEKFVFTTARGTHYTPSSRTHHWNRVRCGVDLPDMSLYLATRHYFGWYAINILGLPPHVVAEQLGHKDGGKLVTKLYGHPDASRARKMIREAHDKQGRVTPLRLLTEESA